MVAPPAETQASLAATAAGGGVIMDCDGDTTADLLLCQTDGDTSSLTHNECHDGGDWGSLKNLNDACVPPRADLRHLKLLARRENEIKRITKDDKSPSSLKPLLVRVFIPHKPPGPCLLQSGPYHISQ